MRHYTITDQFYYSNLDNHVVNANGTPQVLNLHPASKTLYLRNDGPNDAFLAFDEDVATAGDFKLAPADGLVELRVQAEKIAVVCAALETAAVRISSNY